MSEKAFNNKDVIPDETMIRSALGDKYSYLEIFREYISESIGETREDLKLLLKYKLAF